MQIQVPLVGLPIVMVCLSDGTVVFVRMPGKMVYSLEESGISSFVLPDCISLFDSTDSSREPEEYEYQRVYAYKQEPLLLQWLQQLNIPHPFTGEC